MPNSPNSPDCAHRPGYCALVGRPRSLAALVVAGLFAIGITASSCTASTRRPSLRSALLSATDLGPSWHLYTPSASSARDVTTHDLCGKPKRSNSRHLDSAATAWAVDQTKGPIIGEAIRRYASAADARSVVRASEAVQLPCEFTNAAGTRWRTERLRPPSEGHDGRLFLVRSLDVPDGYNYEVAFTAGPYEIAYVMNVRHPAERDVRNQVAKAWAKAQRAGIDSD